MTNQKLITICGLLTLASTLFAQPAVTPLDGSFVAAGVSYQPGGSPKAAGTGLIAKLVDSSTNTYAFTVADFLPQSLKPFNVNTDVSIGVAQLLHKFGSVEIYTPNAAGVSFTGSNVGWSWGTGVMARIPLKSGASICPVLRTIKSSVNGNSGYQVIVGVLFSPKL